MPKLKLLHLENDNLKKLPENIKNLTHLEKLFINDNKFKNIPLELRSMYHLQYLDIKNNMIDKNLIGKPNQTNFGFRINF